MNKKKFKQVINVLTNKDFFAFPSALSYYFVLALIPLLFLVEFLLSCFSIPSVIIAPIIKAIPGVEQSDFDNFFIHRQAVDVIAFSIAFILSYNVIANAIKAILTIGETLFAEFTNSKKIKKVHLLLKAYKITALLLLFMVAGSLLIIVVEDILKNYLTSLFLTPLLVFLFLFVAIIFLYKVIPHKNIKYRTILPGALTATILITSTLFIFRFLTTSFIDFNNIYGPLGYVVSLLLICYFIALALFIGMIIVALQVCQKLGQGCQIKKAKNK